MTRRQRILQKIVDRVLPGYFVISPAYERVEASQDVVGAGSGPERCSGWVWDNPNWHYNRAANEVAIAQWLEVHGQ